MALARLRAIIVALFALAAPSAAMAARVVDGLAMVQTDGSLRVGGENVYLWGIYLPRLDRTCSTFVRPPRVRVIPGAGARQSGRRVRPLRDRA